MKNGVMTLRIGFAAIPYNNMLLPVTSKKSASVTMERLARVAEYVHGLGIDFYRIPANISPYESLPSIEEAKNHIHDLGLMFRRFNIRTCFHATYYCILNTPRPEVLEKAITELRCLCLYDRYAGGGNHIEIHTGGAYGDRKASISRFIENVLKLDDDIFRMLRLENEEHEGKAGTVEELEHINHETGIPLLFDIAHYRVNPIEQKTEPRQIVERFLDTWHGSSTSPVLHYSTILGGSGKHLPVDPIDFWEYVEQLSGLTYDVMLETKEKERDVLKVKSSARANGIKPQSI
jgi:UV DNA damage endonuclease